MAGGVKVKAAERIGVAGASGTGKSTRIKELLRELNPDFCIIFDPLDEYRQEIKGFARCTTLREAAEVMRNRWQGSIRIIYVPPAGREIEALYHLSNHLVACQSGYKAGTFMRECLLVVEEINLSFPTRIQDKYVQGGFGSVCSRGRHYGINVLAATQRIAEVNTRFKGNCRQWYFFAQSNATDVQAIIDILGRNYADHLKGLKVHEYLVKDALSVNAGMNKLKRK